MQAMNPDDPDNQTAMYCNKYPSTKGKQFPEGALRIYAHTDFELLTLLFTRPGILLCKAQVSCIICLHKMNASMVGCST